MARELTKREKSRIHRLVTSECANYDPDYGCLPLDGCCYMDTIAFTNSSLCRYFRDCLLPLDPELMAVFSEKASGVCGWCGGKFPEQGKQKYCSASCREAAARHHTKIRVRKHRANNRGM